MSVSNELAPIDRAYILAQEYVSMVGVPPPVRNRLGEEEVGILLTFSSSMEDVSKWVLTDLLLWAEEQAAKTTGASAGREFWWERDRLWEQILKHCKSEISKHTAYNMATCGRAWPWSRRRHSERVSYEHHRILSSRSEDEQEYWMDLVEAGEMSVARLRAALYSGSDPLMPVANMTVLPRVELWPTSQIEEEIYRALSNEGIAHEFYGVIAPVMDVILRIKGDYEREYQLRRGTRQEEDRSLHP